MKNFKKVSIVILAFNNLNEATRPCIDSLYATTPKEYFDLILIDNGSSDGTEEYFNELCAKHDNINIVINKENYGFSRGNNIGLLKSLDKEYIFIVNNDILFTDKWLDKMISVFDADSSVGIVSPVTNFCDKSSKQYVEIPDVNVNNYNDLVNYYTCNKLEDVDRLIFFCVGLRRSLVLDIGFLDERFSPCWFEDDDYCMRAKMAGYKLKVFHLCFVYHNHSKTTSSLVDGNSIFIRNKKYLANKYSMFAHSFLSNVINNKNKAIYKLKTIAYFKFFRISIVVFYDKG